MQGGCYWSQPNCYWSLPSFKNSKFTHAHDIQWNHVSTASWRCENCCLTEYQFHCIVSSRILILLYFFFFATPCTTWFSCASWFMEKLYIRITILLWYSLRHTTESYFHCVFFCFKKYTIEIRFYCASR